MAARPSSPASGARRRSPVSSASCASTADRRSPVSSATEASSRSAASEATSRRSPARARSPSRARPRGAPKRSGAMVTAGVTAKRVARSLWRLCTSHDFSFRPSHAQELQREFSLLRRQSPGLFWTYFFSSFTYSLIGASMLLLFELPTVFRDSAPLPYEAYAALLLVQGLLSFAADVWARALRGFPRHAWYRVPRRPRLQPRALPHQMLPTQPTPRHTMRLPLLSLCAGISPTACSPPS